VEPCDRARGLRRVNDFLMRSPVLAWIMVAARICGLL
jgi:hypothetical protein